MRRKIVASSWKMHINSIVDGKNLAKDICDKVGKVEDVDIFILPTFPMIHTVSEEFKGSNIKYGAQNVCFAEKGAYTGEVPANVLKEIGCTYVELGHAERKAMFSESDILVNRKVKICEKYDLIPVVCIGETKEDLDNNIGKQTLKTQVEWALEGLSDDFRKKVILAYEPVWAIGQPKAARPEYVNETHKYIRKIIEQEYGKEVANSIRVIYGGSVSPETAPDLVKYEDIDGLFIGRFGLKGENFKAMVDSALNVVKKAL
ncbi:MULTISPECIES: triose-phosphate isomerase [unclassified Romboutsia]|uniref:triose-phosphate isomerase n=1 Tax=unclassified Romboutsia TaxID=2626894 RepID=UPI00082264E1|nr:MULTISPECIES: triose-phosphate isomerase [unclassified Romboutsia]SCH50297.1 Triosephosphate isomerase [uncultured Clostridium sp.]